MTSFEAIKRIQNVDAYTINFDQLIYVATGTLFNNNKKVFDLNEADRISNVSLRHNNYYVSINTGRCLVINLMGDSITLPFDTDIDIFIGPYLHKIEFDISTCKTTSSLLDPASETEVFRHNNLLMYSFSNNTLFFPVDANSIGIYDFENEVQQQISTEVNLSNSKFLGAIHDRLFILTKEHRIIVLDTIHGDLLKTFEWQPEIINGEKFKPYPTEIFMHPVDKYLYCLRNYFLKINTETLEIEKQEFIRGKDPNFPDLMIRNSSYQGDYIAYAGMTPEYHAMKYIGLFDYRKEEFVWSTQLIPDKSNAFITASTTPQLAGNKLYCLDSENTLHVLEREISV